MTKTSQLNIEKQSAEASKNESAFFKKQANDLQTKLEQVGKEHALIQQELIEEGKSKFNSQMQFSESIR